ncbi:MAG: hypothetical protein Kow0037_12720 [Calditrichia bacterium]
MLNRQQLLKLRKMSGAEITFRVRQKLRHWREIRKSKGKPLSEQAELFIPKYLLKNFPFKEYFPPEDKKFFGFAADQEELRQAFNQRFDDRIPVILARAERLLTHRFHFLGQDFKISDPILWNQNPISGAVYPQKHWSELPFADSATYGDVKFVWELNRHQFFIDVAKAYFVSGNEKFAQKIRDWLESWFEQNPYKIGVNHTSVLEHAVRVYSWVWTYFFTRDSAIWTPNLLKKLTRQLILHGLIIEENLSYYFSPYNHLVGELSALTLLGELMPDCPSFKGWGDKYWAILEEQLDFQFNNDGFTVEQASYYHHFTLGFYLQNVVLRLANGKTCSPRALAKIEKAVEASLKLMRPDRHWPMIGDIDSARSLYFYEPDDMWDLRYVLAIGAVLFERPDFKFAAEMPQEEILWLFGPAGLIKFDELKSEPPEIPLNSLPESGYQIYRESWERDASYLLMETGPIAHGVHPDATPSAAHGHADILSFELALNGRPTLVDPGFHNYFGDLGWHRYYRSTRGHNCVEVENAGQAIHQGRIGWSNVSEPEDVQVWDKPELKLVSAKINRFAGIPDTVRQQRVWVVRPGEYFLVVDRIFGEEEAALQINSFLHFAPGNFRWVNNRIYSNEEVVGFTLLPNASLVEVECGGKTADSGWVCKGYGYKTAAPVLKIYVKEHLPCFLAYLFTPNQQVKSFNWQETGKEIIEFDIEGDNLTEKMSLNFSGELFSVPGDDSVKSDAFLALAVNEKVYLYNAGRLQNGEEDWMNTPEKKQCRILSLATGKVSHEPW